MKQKEKKAGMDEPRSAGWRISSMLRTLSLERGNRREELVDQALEILKNNFYIRVFYRHDFLDFHRGIDRVMIDHRGRIIKFQIKGSDVGIKEHIRKFPHVPVVKIEGHESVKEVVNILIGKFNLRLPDWAQCINVK